MNEKYVGFDKGTSDETIVTMNLKAYQALERKLSVAKSALEAARSEICTLEGPLGLACNPVQKQIEQALAEINDQAK